MPQSCFHPKDCGLLHIRVTPLPGFAGPSPANAEAQKGKNGKANCRLPVSEVKNSKHLTLICISRRER